MTTLPARTHGSLYLAIARDLSQADPALAQQMTAEELLFEKQDELTPNIVEPCTFCGRSGKECLCDDVGEW